MRKVLLLFFWCVAVNVEAQTTRSFVGDSLDTYIDKALKEWQIPGVAVCIVKDGKKMVEKGYGVADIQTGAKVNAHTLFMIGSNTKAFTGTALTMLHLSKKMSLERPVIEQLPDFKLYDPWVTRETNAIDLLTHRIGYDSFQGDFIFFNSDLSPAEVREKFSQLKPAHSFRSRWGYCNASYVIAGDLVSKVSGSSWARFISDSIFTVLGMNRSIALAKDLHKADNIAAAHTVSDARLKKIPYGQIDNLSPAGSISSSVNDLANWVSVLLDSGRLDGRQVIPRQAISITQRPWSLLGEGGAYYNTGHFALYGLGWMLQEYAGRKVVSHTGGVNGFLTSITLIPEEKLGIIVLTNTDANNFYEALKWELMDAFLQLPYRDYNSLLLNEHLQEEEKQLQRHLEKKQIIARNPKPSFPIRNILGTYVHPIYGKLTISENKGKFLARFEHHKRLTVELNPLGENLFYAEYSEDVFGRNDWSFTVENGMVRSVSVRVSGFVENNPYEFNKDKTGK